MDYSSLVSFNPIPVFAKDFSNKSTFLLVLIYLLLDSFFYFYLHVFLHCYHSFLIIYNLHRCDYYFLLVRSAFIFQTVTLETMTVVVPLTRRMIMTDSSMVTLATFVIPNHNYIKLTILFIY
jgi:hypothetical protein